MPTYPALSPRAVPASPPVLTAPRTWRAVLLGCGVVGGGVVGHLPASVELAAILAHTPRPGGLAGVPVHTDPEQVFATDPDLVIEALPDIALAERLVERAVLEGRAVITANKAVAARRPDLVRRAAEQGSGFACSAAVGGGAPVLETVSRLSQSDAGVVRVRGVLNGTSNFVLDRLAAGEPLDLAVKAAQEAGFAEADPSADLDGVDAANKLVLIARAAWGLELSVDQILTQSIHDLPEETIEAARANGRVLRQVASLSRTPVGVRAKVKLDALSVDDPLSRTQAEGNCVVLTPGHGAPVIVTGKGAGRGPTAASVLSDVHRLCQA